VLNKLVSSSVPVPLVVAFRTSTSACFVSPPLPCSVSSFSLPFLFSPPLSSPPFYLCLLYTIWVILVSFVRSFFLSFLFCFLFISFRLYLFFLLLVFYPSFLFIFRPFILFYFIFFCFPSFFLSYVPSCLSISFFPPASFFLSLTICLLQF
jgi:hypothetical protein